MPLLNGQMNEGKAQNNLDGRNKGRKELIKSQNDNISHKWGGGGDEKCLLLNMYSVPAEYIR